MANPILDGPVFRRDLPEARELERLLAERFFAPEQARHLAQQAGLSAAVLDLTGPPTTFWAAILDRAAASGSLRVLLDRIAAVPSNQSMQAAIAAVRAVSGEGGSLQPTRLLLSGDRPFLGRKNLRELLPELQNWSAPAAVLVVRGDPDSGRTETQSLLADHNTDRMLLLGEELQLKSTLRAIWKAAGAAGEAPAPGTEPLTTESAMLADFWTDVKEALETNDRRLWVLFDDLDKGPGRMEVRALAEVLAIRLKDISFQRRIRLVLLGYPEPQLPMKVPGALIRNDLTEQPDESHVQAFLDYCLSAAGKNFDPASLSKSATEICDGARAKVSPTLPFLEVLNGMLTKWHKDLK